MGTDAVAGWYGKLPMLGDFAHRRLPAEFIRTCDNWLAECIASSRQSLGDAWLDRYLHAPLWSFAWAPQVVDDGWWFGVMMPSADAVGRYFPLVIALRSPTIPYGSKGLDRLAQWFDHAADCAVGALAQGATVEAFDADLQTPWAALLADDGVPTVDERGERRWISPRLRFPESFGSLALHLVGDRLPGHTVWWRRATEDRSSGTIDVLLGLPSPANFVAMLCDGAVDASPMMIDQQEKA
jgi:type VI secretion system protein ImpM